MSREHGEPSPLPPTAAFTLSGDFFHRHTLLTPEGVARLHHHGLVVVVTRIFPGGIGCSTTVRELGTLADAPSFSTGDIMRQFAAADGFYGDEGLRQFVLLKGQDPKLDVDLDMTSIAQAAELARTHGLVFIDSNLMGYTWRIWGNDIFSPLFLTAIVTAPASVARNRLLHREKQRAAAKHLPPPNLSQVVRTRVNRSLEDRARWSLIYRHFRGPQTLAQLANFPPFDTSQNPPTQVALSILAALHTIPQISNYLHLYIR